MAHRGLPALRDVRQGRMAFGQTRVSQCWSYLHYIILYPTLSPKSATVSHYILFHIYWTIVFVAYIPVFDASTHHWRFPCMVRYINYTPYIPCLDIFLLFKSIILDLLSPAPFYGINTCTCTKSCAPSFMSCSTFQGVPPEPGRMVLVGWIQGKIKALIINNLDCCIWILLGQMGYIPM